MSTVSPHVVDVESFEDEAPIYIPQIGTYQFTDGKSVFCEVLWGKSLLEKSIIKNQEDDYDI